MWLWDAATEQHRANPGFKHEANGRPDRRSIYPGGPGVGDLGRFSTHSQISDDVFLTPGRCKPPAS